MTVAELSAVPFYRVGTPGTPWGEAERATWKAGLTRQRSYKEEVLDKLAALHQNFDVVQYGALSHGDFPLYALRSKSWGSRLPCVLVTGGVHGYETSGVQGALAFSAARAPAYAGTCNLLIVPCVSPWAYEYVQRWNADALDPNRSFKGEGTSEEARALTALVRAQGVPRWACHIDLHETTDTDETEFRPAKAAEAGKMEYVPDVIPDGFYLVADAARLQLQWQEAIREAVRKVTHIAPADSCGRIIGCPVVEEGIVSFPAELLGLCLSLTDAEYATTTEVYPDSPKASDEICNAAQVAAVAGAIDFMLTF